MRMILSGKIEVIDMDREQLRLILEQLLETGISDFSDNDIGWISNRDYIEAKEQNLEGSINMILNLLEKGLT